MPIATDIRYSKADKVLRVAFDDGTSVALPAEYMRVESPSAEVQGHGPNQRKTIPGRRHVGIMEVEPVGNYAIRVLFDDLHDTGLFTWEFLAELGATYERRWAAYQEALAAQGLSRDP